MNHPDSVSAPRFDVVVVGDSLASYAFAEDLCARRNVSVAIVPTGRIPEPIAETMPLGSPIFHSPESLELLADGVASFSRSFHDTPGVFARTGQIILAPEPASVALLRWTADTLSMAGAEARFVSPDEARELCPALPPRGETLRTAFGALWCAFGGVAWVEQMRRATFDAAVKAGVALEFDAPFRSIESTRGKVVGVGLTNGAKISAATVVAFETLSAIPKTRRNDLASVTERAALVMATQPLRFPINQVVESVQPRFTIHTDGEGAAVVYAPLSKSLDGAPQTLTDAEGAVARAIVDLFPMAADIRIAWRNQVDRPTGVDGLPIFGPSGRPGLLLGIGLELLGPWVEHAAALRLSRYLAGEADSVLSWSIDRFSGDSPAVGDQAGLFGCGGSDARPLTMS